MKKDYLRPPIYPGCLNALLASTVCLAVAGCSGAGTRATSPHPVNGGVLAFKAARTRSGSRAVLPPRRFFASTSLWNKPLALQAPVDPNSAEMLARFDGEVAQEQSERRGPWINTVNYSVPIDTVAADQPTLPVQLDHAPEPALSSAWSAVPLPASALPSGGTDAALVVWQPSSDRMWEFWRLNRQEDGWHASWGGAIEHVSRNAGVYGPEAWPGAEPWWGASASSLALAGGLMRVADLRRGKIDHALAVAIPEVRAGVFASPAKRTDGRSSSPLALPEGAHLRLDPQLDLASLQMPPVVRMMAVAAQRYGIVVRDFAGNVAFAAEDPAPTESNPYTGPAGFFEGKSPTELLASFPWGHLQVLRMELHNLP